jgi:hypothetical protein
MRPFVACSDHDRTDFWREVAKYPDVEPPANVAEGLERSLPKRAQFRVYVGLSPTFGELYRSFGHRHSPGATLSYRRPLPSGRSDGGLLRRQLVVSSYVITLTGACHEESVSWLR